MRALVLVVVLLVSACASRPPPRQVVCPHMEAYSKEDQAQRAKEFKARKLWQDARNKGLLTDGQMARLRSTLPKTLFAALVTLMTGRMENRFLRDYGAIRSRLRSVNCKEK